MRYILEECLKPLRSVPNRAGCPGRFHAAGSCCPGSAGVWCWLSLCSHSSLPPEPSVMLSMARCCWAKAAGTPGSTARHLGPGQKQGGALQEQPGVVVGSVSSQELCGATKDGVRGELLDPFCSKELELGPANSHPGATRSPLPPPAARQHGEDAWKVRTGRRRWHKLLNLSTASHRSRLNHPGLAQGRRVTEPHACGARSWGAQGNTRGIDGPTSSVLADRLAGTINS